MHWLLIAQLLALTLISVRMSEGTARRGLRTAWFWLALAPLSQFAMSLFRAGNLRDARDLALIGVWADGLGWLFVGLSIVCLGRGVAGRE
ncbi:hypothetical protein [Luteolibacter marinus]|uniref:hypothetical protein n=1 Tax=Luteolibacter marinus TaxID=2776705 RepID=UPI001D02CB89|nr:hypothetical protein [Luteolibacter marinus]